MPNTLSVDPSVVLQINEHGEFEECGAAAGRFPVVSEEPVLRECIRSAVASQRQTTRFIWIDRDRRWLSITVESDQGLGIQGIVSALPIPPPFDLTVRELDILTLLASGLSNPAIASRLGRSRRTISTHVERILRKLGQTTRAGAAVLAVDQGLLRVPSPDGGIPVSLAAQEPDTGRTRHRGLNRRKITIGAPLSLHGFAGTDAVEMLNGAQLAVREINARGGVLGRQLDLKVVDCDVSQPKSVARAFRTLVDAEVEAIVSGYTAAQHVAHDIAADYGCLYLNNATLESMVERVRQDRTRFRNVFQIGPSDIYYGPGFVRFLNELESQGHWRPASRRLAVIQPAWPEMDIGFRGLERIASRHGWTIDLLDDLPLVHINWSRVVEWIHNVRPAAILLAYYFPEETIAFLRSFAADPANALVYTLYGPSVPVFRHQLGGMAEGVIWATVTGMYSDILGRGFAERYESAFGVRPGRSHASIAYDRVNMLANAWARAGNPRSFDRVGEELRSFVYRGVNGSYALDNTGQSSLSYPDATLDPSMGQAHLVYQIQGGRQRILSPSPYCDSVFQLPPWFDGRK
ncbi:MAG: ABC transporter substrate-binding protein [Bauldia sp.]|nr:ABC transporter substrate-binding protein [Bauldia sp.]